jgi:hypothetical protein
MYKVNVDDEERSVENMSRPILWLPKHLPVNLKKKEEIPHSGT